MLWCRTSLNHNFYPHRLWVKMCVWVGRVLSAGFAVTARSTLSDLEDVVGLVMITASSGLVFLLFAVSGGVYSCCVYSG